MKELLILIVAVDCALGLLSGFDHSADVLKHTKITNSHNQALKNSLACASRPPAARRHRAHDARCSNRHGLGAPHQPMKRLLNPDYSDPLGFGFRPRSLGLAREHLPSARLVSRLVHTADSHPDAGLTMFVMQMGQFIDHDLTKTPNRKEEDPSIRCCGLFRLNETVNTKECFPIQVESDDPDFREGCMEFVRSTPHKMFGWREQTNELTAFLDASAVYGSSKAEADALRTRSLGDQAGYLLQTTVVDGQERLPKAPRHPVDPSTNCSEGCCPAHNSYCQMAGDGRVNEQPFLGSMHLMFHLFHNKIARQIGRQLYSIDSKEESPKGPLGPVILDNIIRLMNELVYQETRKLVSAVLQKIVYCDWLPLVVGPKLIKQYALGCEGRSVYIPYTDPRISNEFSSAAFRFGHTLIPETVKIGNKTFKLNEVLEKPTAAQHNYDDLLGHMCSNRSEETFDRHVASAVTKHLFETSLGSKKLDLAAINIQRGRDHGLPGYLHYRPAAMGPINKFDDFGSMGSKLAKLYKSVWDVDLYTGSLLEPSMPDAVVGPTFGHIIARQFRDIKYGDQYFFTHHYTQRGFTDDQLAWLRGVTLGDVMCAASKSTTVQRDVFKPLGPSNPSVPCSAASRVIHQPLHAWRDSMTQQYREAVDKAVDDSKPDM